MDPCVESTKNLSAWGYPRVYTGKRKPRYRAMSRVLWEQSRGPIPAGMLVCHHCDNPRCIKLEHLFLGTPKDNAQDMARKGRQWLQRDSSQRRGERHPMAKLTAAQVRAVRERHAAGEKQKDIAASLSVSFQTISRIVRNERWKEQET